VLVLDNELPSACRILTLRQLVRGRDSHVRPLTISYYFGVGVGLAVDAGVGLFSGFSGVGEAEGFSGVGVDSGVGLAVTLGLGDGEAVALLEGP
jgi:hypothetical protein